MESAWQFGNKIGYLKTNAHDSNININWRRFDDTKVNKLNII